MRLSPLILAFALVGCAGETATKDAGTGADECKVTIKTTTPTADATNAYYRGTIEFELTDADPSATITTDIPGAQSVRGDKTIVWTPSAPLAPLTAYSATLSYCGGDATINFTTSDLGTSIADAQTLLGRTYNLALGDARIVEPAGIGSLLGQYLTVDILTGVAEVSDTNLTIIGSLGVADSDPPIQDFCNPTIPFPEADFTDAPYFLISGAGTDTHIQVAGYDVVIQDLIISGTFAPDGSYYGGGVLEGTIDTRAFDKLVSDDAEEGAVCGLAPSFGVECQACPGGAGDFCLSILADSIIAEEVSGTSLVEQAGNDCTGCETWTEDTVPAEADQTCPME